jgi:hypothetical protein
MDLNRPHGIISLLDSRHEKLVKALWADLRSEFGLQGGSGIPFPHFAYQVAGHYNPVALKEALARVAKARPRFKARVSGLALLEDAKPTLYLRLVRNPDLLSFQQAVWQSAFFAANDLAMHYHPDRWVPHITLAHGDLTRDAVPYVLEFLAQRELEWEIPVENLALVEPGEERPRIKWRFDLGT